MQCRLLHHAPQRSLSKKIALIAAPHIGMSTYHGEFVEIHPKLGEVIMSTLAIACAKDEGFDIVTDNAKVHHSLVNQDDDAAYVGLMGNRRGTDEEQQDANAEKLLEVIVFQHCDTDDISAEKIAKLGEDWEALTDFRGALQSLASSIPNMRNETRFRERLEATANDALDKWRKDRLNMGAVAKQTFGIEGTSTAGDIAKTLVAQITAPIATGAAAGWLLGFGAGAAIGVVVHATTSWGRVHERARNGPFRYLTAVQRSGVTISLKGSSSLKRSSR